MARLLVFLNFRRSHGPEVCSFIAYDDEPNTKRYSAEFQTQDEYVKGWQSALKKAHHTSGQKSVISCGCRGKGAKRLYVRSLPNSDTFILIKAANTGTEHDPSCVFSTLMRAYRVKGLCQQCCTHQQ